jgi:ribosome biogenesis GTPase
MAPEALDAHIRGNRTVALLGLSGAGKSTLINRLVGEERLRTQDVRPDGRGRHTTSHREPAIPLPSGGVLIDTPGMRSVSMWDGDGDGLEQTFADVYELAAGCRFSDCKHEGEPGCAVIAAIAAGTLAPDRLESYNKLLRELRFQELKQDKRARSEQRQQWKTLRQMRTRRGRRGTDGEGRRQRRGWRGRDGAGFVGQRRRALRGGRRGDGAGARAAVGGRVRSQTLPGGAIVEMGASS